MKHWATKDIIIKHDFTINKMKFIRVLNSLFKPVQDLKPVYSDKKIFQFLKRDELHSTKRIIISLLIITSMFASMPPIYGIHMPDPSIEFNFPTYSFANGSVLLAPTIITVVDSAANLDPTLVDTISLTVTSDTDPVGIELVFSEEDHDSPGTPDPNSGIFRNKNLIFLPMDYQFTLTSTPTILLEDSLGNLDGSTIETIDAFAIAYSALVTGDPGTTIPMTETGPNTGLFSGTLGFTSGTSSGNLLHAENGDVITVVDTISGAMTNALIIPNPDPGVGAIRANIDDTITATYGLLSATTLLQDDGFGVAPGGSGGGLLRPGFVLDVVGGTSGGDFSPPQLVIPKLNLSNLPLIDDMLDFILNADPFTVITPLDDSSIDYPLSINGNGYLLTQFANTIQTYTGKTGEPISFKMALFDATGIKHIALYTNLRGDQREISDSDTFIIYNEDKPLEITDPHRFFSNVNFTESEYNGKYLAEFNMTFAKPMDTSDVIIRTWDELLNSGDIKILNAIKIEGEPIVNPDTNNLIVPESSSITIPYYKLPYYEIPNADSAGNLIYYNSFGGLEEKQVHPYYTSVVYPDNIGKKERHDDLFKEYQEEQKLLSLEISKENYGIILYKNFEFDDLEVGMYPYVNRMNGVLKEKMMAENNRALESIR